MTEWKGDERRSVPTEVGVIKKGMYGISVALLAHFAAGIWWAATVNTNMVFIKEQLIEMKTDIKTSALDRYRVGDASKDFAVITDRIARNEARITSLEQRRLSSPVN